MSLVLHTSEIPSIPYTNQPIPNIRCIDNKPYEAFWVSDLEMAPVFSSWVEWCIDERRKSDEYGFIYDDSQINYLRCEGSEDLDLIAPYAVPKNKQKEDIDFNKMAQSFDGISVDRSVRYRMRVDWTETLDPFHGWDATTKAVFKPQKLKFVGAIRLDPTCKYTTDKIARLLGH